MEQQEVIVSSRWMKVVVGWVAVMVLFASVASSGKVIINEVAWAGTAASPNDEWIELANTSDQAVDLTGWTLLVDGRVIHLGEVAGSTAEVRRSTIEPGGYLLLERTDDTTVSDIEADIIYTGALSNGGEDLLLIDAEGVTADEILAAESGWPAGEAGGAEEHPYATMERFFPKHGVLDWMTNLPEFASNGLDADGAVLRGTPGAENSTASYAAVTPRVQILAPEAGVVEGTVILQWQAVDPDGDDGALVIEIVATELGSLEDFTFAENLANTGSFAWDTTEAPDGVYLIGVAATDGDANTGSGFLAGLEVQNDD